MKKLTIIIYLSILLTGCDRKSNNSISTMPPELGIVLDEYIANNPKNDIYYMIFENRNDKQFFTLQCSSDCYDSKFVDGCFMRNGKIIVYWSVNQSLKDSLLHISEEELCFDSLSKYTDFSKTEMNYDAFYNPQTYRILSVSQYRIATDSDWAYSKTACDSNVIRSSVLNKIVNDYINTNNSPNIVYLRFSNMNGDNYVSIGHDYVYDPELFSGMFYRDKRIVVVYSVDKIKNLDIIDKQSMLPIKTISDYKSHKREFPQFPETKYRIKTKENMETISFDDGIWMTI